MDEQQRTEVRTATYLATQQRNDLRGFKATRTGKTSSIKCNPPNVRCGGRCIPPTWDCRLQGKGTNSDLAAHRTDPLAGIASLQRGAKDIAQGVVKLDPSRVQRGRNSLIRGAVKLTPGDNLEQKKQLKRQLTEASTPIMAVLGVGLVGLAAHAGLKRGFSSYRNGIGADVDRAAGRAVDSVLDRMPLTGARRTARRAAGAGAASDIATSVMRGSRLQTTRTAVAGNLRRIGPLSFRPNAADYESSFVRAGLDDLTKSARAGNLNFESWKQGAVEKLYGATSPGNRGGQQRGSIFSENAANEFLVSKFGLNPQGAVSNRGSFSTSARNTLVESQLSQRLGAWGSTMRSDMRLRRMTGPDGAIRKRDVDRYIREVGTGTLGGRFAGMNAAQRNQLTSEATRLMRDTINNNDLGGVARTMRRGLVTEYDSYFSNVASNMSRNAVAADSPFGDGATGLARYVTRANGQSIQIVDRSHADLILRNHFHSRVMRLQNDYAIGDNTAQRIAQRLTRSTTLPDVDSAYRVLNQNGFSQLSRGGARTGQAPARLRNQTQLISDILARKGNEGMSRAAAQREARRIITERGRRDETEPGTIRTATYLAARADAAGANRLGKPCGASHIPKAHECSKGRAAEQGTALKTAAKVALIAGVAVGATAVATNPKLQQRARVEGRLILRGSDKTVRQALMLGGRGTIAGLSTKQVKEGLDRLPASFQGPARKLVGMAKQAAASMSLKAEGYSVQDIDVVNNYSTWKNRQGTLLSIGSYGDSLVTYASSNSHSWKGKRVYKIGFNVDQNFDATRSIPTEQARSITGAVRRMTDNHLSKINDGVLATFPWDGDEYGAKRRAIYTRAGFNNIVGEESQWALVEKGRIKKMSNSEAFVYLAESGERDAPIYKPTKAQRKDAFIGPFVASIT